MVHLARKLWRSAKTVSLFGQRQMAVGDRRREQDERPNGVSELLALSAAIVQNQDAVGLKQKPHVLPFIGLAA